MNDIQGKIKSFLEKYKLDCPEKIFLVAFSGGYDSMCLLDVLSKSCSNKLVAIHLNHCWRGAESDEEEENCRMFCAKLGIDFYSEHLSSDISKTETAAREARYRFFENCAKKFDSNIVFTAHNKNDNAETLIYRICKGTGIAGLQGIAEVRDIYYRPLLDISRDDIEKYCIDNGLKPNFDSSNNNTKYKRNFIRAEILPRLLNINENILDSLTSLSQVAKDETEIVEEYLNLVSGKITEDGKISTKKFLELSNSVQRRIIYNIFIQNNLDYDREKILRILDFVIENSSSKSGKTCSLTKNLWIFVSAQYIKLVADIQNRMTSFNIPKEGIYENNGWIFEMENFSDKITQFPKDDENVAYVDLSNVVKPFNFEVRGRKDGDIITPFGLNGSQKLKKYLNAKKIPNHEKDNLVFLACGNEILWAIGLGISDKIKVTKNPTHRLQYYKKREI